MNIIHALEVRELKSQVSEDVEQGYYFTDESLDGKTGHPDGVRASGLPQPLLLSSWQTRQQNLFWDKNGKD